MLKALTTGRLPGVLPGAESPANLLITNEPVRALAPGKCAPGTSPGSTPGKMCLHDCRLFWYMQAFAGLFQDHISHFQTMPGVLRGVNPWQNEYDFLKKKRFLIV